MLKEKPSKHPERDQYIQVNNISKRKTEVSVKTMESSKAIVSVVKELRDAS